MKTLFRSLLIVCSLVMTISLTGCAEDSETKSVTEGVPLSEIEAYEQAVQTMEAEDAAAMDVEGGEQ